MPPKKAATKKKAASKKKVAKKPATRSKKNMCAKANSGYKRYTFNTIRSRCLPEICSRTKDKSFSYPRGADGHCPRGPVIENIPIGKVAEYEKYRKDLRQASVERSRKKRAAAAN